MPIDMPTLELLRAHWTDIQDRLIADIDGDYRRLSTAAISRKIAFEQLLARLGIPWPRLESGKPVPRSTTPGARWRAAYPVISPLRELRHALSEMRLNALAVGEDGRNRTLLWAFGSKTGRNPPSNTKFIFGPSVWLRGLIKPPPGHAMAYVDWCSQEVGIAAALSGDEAMMSDFRTGDPYVAFGIRAGVLPARRHQEDAPRSARHAQGVRAGPAVWHGAEDVGYRIGQPTIVARELVRAHKDRYRKFWRMAEGAVDCAMQGRPLSTVFGWQVRPVGRSIRKTPTRSMMNSRCRLTAPR